MINKSQLRQEAKLKRKQFCYQASFLKSLQALLLLLDFKVKPMVATYFPLAEEANCWDITHWLNDNAFKVLLPYIKTDLLYFNQWYQASDYLKNKYGIFEIKNKEFYTPDIIIAPLLAFDKIGNRLGYGGGFYDRTLNYYQAKNIKPLYIGLGYAFQIVDKIPSQPHDVPMDYILNENKIITIKV